MAKRFLIASGIQEDQITTAAQASEGVWTDTMLGGAGLYAYAGLRVFTDDVQFVCNVEKGHLKKYRAWYEDNAIETDTICECLEPGSITKITYFEDGTREDAPTDGLMKKRRRNPTIPQVESICKEGIDGLYMFRHLDEPYLEQIIALAKQYGFKALWEIASDAVLPENWEKIRSLMAELSAFSINMQEARMLFPQSSEQEILENFRTSGCPYVFLRNGAKGAYMITPQETVFCESVPNCTVVDTTGAGNASTAGVLYGICCEEPLRMIGIRGSVAASYIIRQYGPPMRFDCAMQQEAEETVNAMCDKNA